MSTKEEDFVDVEKIESFLGQSKKTIYKWCADSKIPHYKFGASVRFLMSEIKAWAKERKAS